MQIWIVQEVNILPKTVLLLQCEYWICRQLAQVCGAVKGNEPAIKQLWNDSITTWQSYHLKYVVFVISKTDVLYVPGTVAAQYKRDVTLVH